MFGGDFEHLRDVVRAERVLSTEGEASSSRLQESQVPSAGRRSFDIVNGVQWVEGEQVLESLVLREFHPGEEHEESARCQEAVGRYHGQVSHICVVRKEAVPDHIF